MGGEPEESFNQNDSVEEEKWIQEGFEVVQPAGLDRS